MTIFLRKFFSLACCTFYTPIRLFVISGRRWHLVVQIKYSKPSLPLRKHAYSNVLKILPPKNWKISDKKFWYFSHFCSKHRLWYSLEPPRRGGSNEYPQSMVLSRNKENNVHPCKPQFYYIKLRFKGFRII